MNKRKLLTLGMLAVLFAAIPATVFLVQQRQQTETQATAATALSFTTPAGQLPSQTAPLQTKVNDTVSLDIMADPGSNFINVMRLSMTYDPQKLTPTNGSCGKIFCVNTTDHKLGLVGDITNANSTIVFTLATSTPSDALQKATKLGTITFQAKETTAPTTQLSFGQDTFVTSSNCDYQSGTCPDQPGENVLNTLQSKMTAFIAIANANATATTPTVTGGVTPTGAQSGGTPTPRPTTAAAVAQPTIYRAPTASASGQTNQIAPTAIAQHQAPTGQAAPELRPGPSNVMFGIGGVGLMLAVVGSILFFLL